MPRRKWWRPSRRAIGLLLVGAALFGPGLFDWIRMALKQRQLDRQLAQLAARKAQLAEEATRLTSDPGYVEGLIRSTFKMAQPGEYVIPLDEPSSNKPLASR
ncbi:MAG: septum formation initiator family protein [Candidatus Omnitrophica bacterium]|nr:septum formation initiator family protein [Candidatus Omnitrophota bacterium]